MNRVGEDWKSLRSWRSRVSEREREFWVNVMCGILEAAVVGDIFKDVCCILRMYSPLWNSLRDWVNVWSTLNYLLVARLFLLMEHCAETGPCGPPPYLGYMMSGDEFVSSECQCHRGWVPRGTGYQHVKLYRMIRVFRTARNLFILPTSPMFSLRSSPGWGVCEGVIVIIFAHSHHALTVLLQDV